jgi:hypothetical protein
MRDVLCLSCRLALAFLGARSVCHRTRSGRPGRVDRQRHRSAETCRCECRDERPCDVTTEVFDDERLHVVEQSKSL